ncbi:MAG TPA: DUF3887 domain-containing protein [Armatimonadota bacterium]|jgi:hypothetical protein
MRFILPVCLAAAMLAPAASLAAPRAAAKPLPPVVKRAVNAVTAGDPKPLKNDLTPEMAAALTRDVLQATKSQYITPLGPLVSVKIVTTTKNQGFNVTIFQMHFRKGGMTGQMAQDAKSKVAGLYVRPATK